MSQRDALTGEVKQVTSTKQAENHKETITHTSVTCTYRGTSVASPALSSQGRPKFRKRVKCEVKKEESSRKILCCSAGPGGAGRDTYDTYIHRHITLSAIVSTLHGPELTVLAVSPIHLGSKVFSAGRPRSPADQSASRTYPRACLYACIAIQFLSALTNTNLAALAITMTNNLPEQQAPKIEAPESRQEGHKFLRLKEPLNQDTGKNTVADPPSSKPAAAKKKRV
ncbi:hypothetical protein BDV95DRAFT_590361 [Massariosphaeria phaeospora]|uniref:Uncharacterized protein n=1 Tax=Massariosphaeria phaeospora TaxID=100035 RepID=A0A7C8MSY1_9PLEO|nr:hypothetical protein BDV95DRAFT_590361 [Massariosphaeria phaeospora]